MIYKEIPNFSPGHTDVIGFSADEGLNKVAHYNTHIPTKLAHKIQEIERNADPKYAYLYDRALGAGEFYGPNNNGDFFGKEELIKHHDSFVKHAHLFRHHQNNDPKNKIGDVIASDYNHELETVDLIIRAPIEKIAEDLRRFEQGKMIQTSMGAKVPYDECSICANKAKTRAAYCSHLRHMMLRVMPDGRQVYAINPSPKFMDMSIVVIHAAPESAVLRKIASAKFATMKKEEVGSNIDRGVIPPEAIEATSGIGDRDKLVRTFDSVYGTLRPDEFGAIMRKDASLIMTDAIPHVNFMSVPKKACFNDTYTELEDALSSVPMRPLSKTASSVDASFLTKDEKMAYLEYRSSKDFTRDFFK